MKAKTVSFCDFWPSFNPKANFFFSRVLREFNLVIASEDESPEFLIYSVWANGVEHLSKRYKNSKKLCFSGECFERQGLNINEKIKLGHCVIGMEKGYEDETLFFRMPNVLIRNFFGLGLESALSCHMKHIKNLSQKNIFCTFAYNNNRAAERKIFCKKLSEYRAVNCVGRVLNNTDIVPQDRFLNYLEDSIFQVAYENYSYPGYCTEKIWWGFLSGSVPLYWGDPLVHQDLDPNSFLSRHDYNCDESFIESILELSSNERKYKTMLETPKILNRNLWDIKHALNFIESRFIG